MIDLTVKTLDSQNHAFSLEDDQITVRGFKEHIAESVSLPADSQRLIYCGRVLQDDKKLIDYDVNGKVIHLVQRAPPQPGQRRNDGAQGQGQSAGGPGWQNQQRTHYRVTRTQMHGNAMYVGAMAVPAEMVEGPGVPQLSNNLSRCRLLLAERMLQRANALIDRLPDQNGAENTSSSSSSSSTSAMPETSQPPTLAQQMHVQQIETEHFPFSSTDGRGISGTRLPETIAAAIAVALSAAGASNVTLYGGGSEDNVEATPANDASEENQPQPDIQQPQPSQSAEQQAAPSQLPRPPMMAQLLTQLMDTQHNLRTYVDRYRQLMVEDRVLPRGGGPGSVEESQRIVNVVSESLHYLSHACHALSDISVDMSQEPPRNLRCRPIIIQQSTILQPGVPIQTHFSIYGQNANNNNTNEESSQSATTTAQTETNETNPEGNNQQQEQPQSPFGAVFNLPNDMVVMEVSPESNMDTASGSEQTQSGETNNNNNNNNPGRISGPAGAFAWSSTPPPDFIRNVIQAVAGHVIHGGIGPSTITTQSLPTGAQQTVSSHDGNTNAGQSTQARSNVGTHPTTSTQTRSTSRQQAHPLNVGMSVGQGFEFDPFLPCNSHHIRRAPSGTSNTITSMLQRARANQSPITEVQPQPQTATTLITTSNTSTTNTVSTTVTNNTTTTNSTSTTNSANTTTTTNTTSTPTASSSTSSSSSSSSPSTSSSHANPVINLVHQILGGAMDETNPDTDEINFRYSYCMPDLGPVVDMMALNYGQRQAAGARPQNAGSVVTLSTILFGSQDPEVNEENFLLTLALLVVQNMTIPDFESLQQGDWRPICHHRMALMAYLFRTFPDITATEVEERAVNRLLTQLRPHLQSLSAKFDSNIEHNHLDMCATTECLLQYHLKHIVELLLDDSVSNIVFAQQAISILQTLRRQYQTILGLYRSKEAVWKVRRIVRYFLTETLQGYEPIFQHLVRELVLPVSLVKVYPPQPTADLVSFLRYKEPDSDTEQETEPMDTKVTEEKTTLVLPPPEDGEEIPETFLNHEQLPSDWVPIIARDGVRQRRQLQIQGMTNGGVGAFSDAYLGTLPTKRRKLIEQQKPRLLLSPTPNHSAISASIELLVREGVTRAGVEEVAGAAVAVAVDPGVRRAFGQAIRDCLNPRRYESPDFPDPLRFPDATKYFADQDSTPKQ
ncbi:uncharacterized protein LOC144477769 isoform X2 [Augochlora pura]